MAKTHEAPVTAVPSTKTSSEDLSKLIVQSAERQAGEEVRCSRAYGDFYRCNWWVKDGSDPIDSVGGRVVRSRFLRVVNTPDGLVIEDLTR